MADAQKHSPQLPWKTSDQMMVLFITDASGNVVAKGFTPEYRDFIVHRVNSHDALLAALKAMTERYVATVASGDCGHWDAEAEPEVIAARAAILTAEDK